MKPIEMGDFCRDMVTEFEGIAVCRQSWMTGCDRIGLQPRKLKEDGSQGDINWFDEPQLVILKANAVVIPGKDTRKERKKGGPRPGQKVKFQAGK